MIQSEKEILLKKIIPEVIDFYFPEPSGDRILYNSKFDISPREFLHHAEQNIFSSNDLDLINGISNLKRAIDCSLDGFFASLGILKKLKSIKIERRKVSISDKLSFIGEIADFTPKSINRLNKVRNELEHDYKRPRVLDMEVYYDLVFALIIVNENLCFMHSTIGFIDNSERFISKYDINTGSISFSKIPLDEKEINEDNSYSFDITLKDGIPLFLFGLKCHRALSLFTDKIFTKKQSKKYLNFV
jgi:hypothetical protein